VFGSIEEEPGRPSGLNRTITPLRMADHWFLECLSNTMAEGLTLRVTPLEGRPGLWEVFVDSDDDSYGHKCRAVVDESKDLRAVKLDLWDTGRWAARYEMEYVHEDGRWKTARGKRRSFPPPSGSESEKAKSAQAKVRQQPRVERESRFVVRKSLAKLAPGDQVALPSFPMGAQVIDHRTSAEYIVGRDREVDAEFARLLAHGERLSAGSPDGSVRDALGLPRLWYWTNWFAVGAVLASAVFGLQHIVNRTLHLRRRSHSTSNRTSP
jgi:hypothetical protein